MSQLDKDAWKQWFEILEEYNKGKHRGSDGCKECGRPWSTPRSTGQQCSMLEPMHIYIPPGQHIHLPCPVHYGGHIIYGNNPSFW